MKRILAAFVLAIMIHAVFFRFGKYLIHEESVTAPITKVVTMTMFQKEAPKPVKPPKKSIKPPPPKKKPKQKPKKKVLPPPKKKSPVFKEPEKYIEEPEEIEEEVTEKQVQQGKDAANMEAINEAVPLYKINPPPQYPMVARRRGYGGTVLLNVHVKKTGTVLELNVLKSSGYPVLDKAAIKSVKTWEFSPGKKGKTTIDMWVQVPVVFKLE